MSKRLLFYDLETSGLDKSFDQVLQFAAVVTDEDFNEIERYNLLVKLNLDIWPSPAALAVSKITLNDLAKLGDSEFNVISRIHALFNQPNTISLGYNTLRFDDEFLRFSFFRNLLEPYTHQYANGCYRMDIYPMVVLAYLLCPKLLKFPYIDAKISMRLENLRAANHIEVAGHAHDALSDVLATIEVAKLLKQDADFWSFAAAFFIKDVDERRIYEALETLDDEKLKLSYFACGAFGAAHNFTTCTLFLGRHRHYTNQLIWLRLDVEPLNDEALKQGKFILRKKLGEPPFALAKSFIKLNNEANNLIKVNLAYLKKGALAKWQEFWLEYKYPWIVHLDADAAIYQQGLLSDKARKASSNWLSALKAGNLLELTNLYNKQLTFVQQQQAIRVLGRNFPKVLKLMPSLIRRQWEEYLKEALFNPSMLNFSGGKRRSALDFYEELLNNSLVLSDAQRKELQELYLSRQSYLEVERKIY